MESVGKWNGDGDIYETETRVPVYNGDDSYDMVDMNVISETTQKDDFALLTKVPVNARFEDRLFNCVMLILTGIGYFLLSFIFLFRFVILWFLIILSPFLFVLLILPFLRGYFKYWSWLFVRWIVI